LEFSKFKRAVAEQFAKMKEHVLFRTLAGKDEMWEVYLSSFPAGTDPIFRERTEHNCNCCKQFIRAVGNVVAIIDGKLESIWDCTVDDPGYQVVADAMAAFVKSKSIDNIFLHYQRAAGTDKNFEEAVNGITTWEHFYLNIPRELVMTDIQLNRELSNARAQHDVLLRSLTELNDDSIDTVLELIAQNSLYRGSEYKFAVSSFKDVKHELQSFKGTADEFAWVKSRTLPVSVSKIRNTAIGTLLVDISEGQDLEAAVKKFENDIMAPANFKRPTALASKRQVGDAKQRIEDLGLTSALERKYATLKDISINDILFVDRQAKKN
jgi:hypothetical protein